MADDRQIHTRPREQTVEVLAPFASETRDIVIIIREVVDQACARDMRTVKVSAPMKIGTLTVKVTR